MSSFIYLKNPFSFNFISGSHDSLLALFLFPQCLTVTRSLINAESKTVAITKFDVSKTFILHIEVQIFFNLCIRFLISEILEIDFGHHVHMFHLFRKIKFYLCLGI